jgi:hypothetical protein
MFHCSVYWFLSGFVIQFSQNVVIGVVSSAMSITSTPSVQPTSEPPTPKLHNPTPSTSVSSSPKKTSTLKVSEKQEKERNTNQRQTQTGC